MDADPSARLFVTWDSVNNPESHVTDGRVGAVGVTAQRVPQHFANLHRDTQTKRLDDRYVYSIR